MQALSHPDPDQLSTAPTSATAEMNNEAAGGPPRSQGRPKTLAEEAARHSTKTSTPRTNGTFYSLTDLRNEIATEMDGEFMECPMETFVRHYLPFEPSESDVEALITRSTYTPESAIEPPAPRLADGISTTRQPSKGEGSSLKAAPGEQHILEIVEGKLRFMDYHTIATTGGENQAYSYLQRIIRAVGTASIEGRPPNGFRYYPCPQTVVESEMPGSNNKIDGCILSEFCTLDGQVRVKTTGIAVAFEYKLDSGDLEKVTQNNKRVVSANIQIMNDDVRRMFTYGVTIVGDMVKLWYHGRSHSAVSRPFSFVEDPRLFVKVMMSFLFATEAELGYDSKVTRLHDNRLVFEMEDEQNNPTFYRTVRTLSEYRSNNITGRMTRVWQVDQVTGSEEGAEVLSSDLVLRDVWLDESALTERQIQERIFAAIERRKVTIDSNKCVQQFEPRALAELKGLLDGGRYKEYFMTILADYSGQVSKALPPGARRKRGLLSSRPAVIRLAPSQSKLGRVALSTTRATQLEEAESVAQTPLSPRVFRPKRQYRTVYAELCKTVGKMETLGEVVEVLDQTLVALRLLYFAGWVHRDISTGNVMGYSTKIAGGPSRWQAKLSDLEYAKEYSTAGIPASVDHKTGTPYFMAHEILDNKPLMPPLNEQDPEADDLLSSMQADQARTEQAHANQAHADQAQAEVTEVKEAGKTPPSVVVLHNFQHDLESIFWITMYSVTARVDWPPAQEYAKKIFKNTVHMFHERAQCLEKSLKQDLELFLPPVLLPIASRVLEHLRGRLMVHYLRRNTARLSSGIADDTESYAAIHNAFFIVVRPFKDWCRSKRVGLITGTGPTNILATGPRIVKRPRSTRNEDDEDYRKSPDEAAGESDIDWEPRKAGPSKKTKS